MATKPTQIVTGKVRLSYAHLFKPYAHNPGQEPKYSVTILVPKTDTVTKVGIDRAIEAAKQEGIKVQFRAVNADRACESPNRSAEAVIC